MYNFWLFEIVSNEDEIIINKIRLKLFLMTITF
jgi:hypothetical protein